MNLKTFMRVVAALTAVVSAAVAATASLAATPALFCSASSLSKPFLSWGDSSAYALVPDGGFEAGGAGWTLAGGASIAFGNESYRVRDAGDARMLSLPAGASATSPALCVDLSVPTLRFFASAPLGSTSQLRVDALYVDSSGVAAWHALGALGGGRTGWQPTRVFQLPTKIQSPSVRLRFSATAGTGSYRLDDVYVDPYIRV